MELNLDPEGGHYASDFVNINRGSYEGQLVIGDSFVHPIKEFTVSNHDDIIVLQFKITKGVGVCVSMAVKLCSDCALFWSDDSRNGEISSFGGKKDLADP